MQQLQLGDFKLDFKQKLYFTRKGKNFSQKGGPLEYLVVMLERA